MSLVIGVSGLDACPGVKVIDGNLDVAGMGSW